MFLASVVIVNFNGRHLLGPCLTAVLEQARPLGAEVILVDNASADGSVEYVRSAFPDVAIVANQRNEGYAGGCNAGVRAASGDVIVLLNNDAVPEPGWLEELVSALEPEDVAVACSVIHEERYPEAYSLGTGSISVIGHPIVAVLADPEHPFYAPGCSVTFKRQIFGEPFDPLFFAYYEDTLLSWRAHLMGYEVARALRSRVRHLGSATASRQPAAAAFYWERNKLLTLLLCYEGRTLWKLLPLYLFDGLARVAEDLWRLARRPRAAPRMAGEACRRYVILLRALGWLLAHPSAIRRRRRAIQAERRVSDRAITSMLSGKIFDDHVPTRGHTIANAIAQRYCRLAGIATAPQREPSSP